MVRALLFRRAVRKDSAASVVIGTLPGRRRLVLED